MARWAYAAGAVSAKKIGAVFATFIIAGLLLMSGSASAFNVSNWQANNAKPVTGSTVVIDVDVAKLTNEVINPDSIELRITDAGGNVSTADFMNCTPAYYLKQGYGYGSLGENAGFGYGFGYGMGGEDGKEMKCKFQFTPETTGKYSTQLFINGKKVGEQSGLFEANQKGKK
ncbi:MAG TPA: hypothetical protein VFF13_02100 [archaeon]|nr:hypothetical protein [archaeon]